MIQEYFTAWELAKRGVLLANIRRNNPLDAGHTRIDGKPSTDYTGLLGVPVIENVRLKSVDGNVDLLLPDALCVVTMSKNIIKTPLQGRSGTVKEYITDGDYQVTVNGTITDPTPDTFPEAEVGQLIHLCQLPEAVDVVSEFLQGLGIFQLVVESYNLNQESGYINRQKYSLKCLSDQPLELTIDN